jgi:hypothetical protein
MTTSVAEASREPAIRFHLVHAVRGRTRMRVTPPHLAADLARAFERLLRDHPGVREVRGNPDSGSVVVTYDPDVLDVDRLFLAPPEPPPSAWLDDLWSGARAVLDGWADAIRRAPAAALERSEAASRASLDQIRAAMSFWSASSVLARSRRLLQVVVPGSLRETEAPSRR